MGAALLWCVKKATARPMMCAYSPRKEGKQKGRSLKLRPFFVLWIVLTSRAFDGVADVLHCVTNGVFGVAESFLRVAFGFLRCAIGFHFLVIGRTSHGLLYVADHVVGCAP